MMIARQIRVHTLHFLLQQLLLLSLHSLSRSLTVLPRVPLLYLLFLSPVVGRRFRWIHSEIIPPQKNKVEDEDDVLVEMSFPLPS